MLLESVILSKTLSVFNKSMCAMCIQTHTHTYILLKFIYILFFCTGFSLLCVSFIQLWQVGANFCSGTQTFHCGGCSCCRAQSLGGRVAALGLSSCGVWLQSMWVSVVVAHRLSSCGAWSQLLRSMWNLPRTGIKPVFLALAGRFLSTAPPEKSSLYKYIWTKL